MRRLYLLLGLLFVVPLLGSDSPKEYSDKTANDGIEGTWLLTGGNDKKGPPSEQLVYAFRSGTITFKVGKGETWRGNYRIDPTRKPPYLDMYSTKWIYQVDGDTLRIAYIPFEFSERRPKGFDDKGIAIQTYKRVK